MIELSFKEKEIKLLEDFGYSFKKILKKEPNLVGSGIEIIFENKEIDKEVRVSFWKSKKTGKVIFLVKLLKLPGDTADLCIDIESYFQKINNEAYLKLLEANKIENHSLNIKLEFIFSVIKNYMDFRLESLFITDYWEENWFTAPR